jgi:molybdate-binding protein
MIVFGVLNAKELIRNFKVTEVNRRRGSGTREKVRRISLECNIFAHGTSARNLPV